MMRNLCPLTNVTSVSVNMERLCALHVNAVSTFCSNYYYMVLPLFNEEAHVTYMTIYLKAAIVRLRNHARISFQQIVLGLLAQGNNGIYNVYVCFSTFDYVSMTYTYLYAQTTFSHVFSYLTSIVYILISACKYNSVYYQYDQTFKDECNTCTCEYGDIKCTNNFCGRQLHYLSIH